MSKAGDATRDADWQGYREELYRFVLKRVRREAVAEDIVHSALLKAWSQRESLKSPERLRPWLYRITRHALADHFRARHSMEALPGEVEAPRLGTYTTATPNLAACVGPLAAHLPPIYRVALTRSDLQGDSHRKIASELGLSISGVKSRVQRGRRMLRDGLMRCCHVASTPTGEIRAFEVAEACNCADAGTALASCGMDTPPPSISVNPRKKFRVSPP